MAPHLIVINLYNTRSDFYENNSAGAQCTNRGFQIKIILHPSSFNSSILTNSLPDNDIAYCILVLSIEQELTFNQNQVDHIRPKLVLLLLDQWMLGEDGLIVRRND